MFSNSRWRPLIINFIKIHSGFSEKKNAEIQADRQTQPAYTLSACAGKTNNNADIVLRA
jgi:hypothetical protein